MLWSLLCYHSCFRFLAQQKFVIAFLLNGEDFVIISSQITLLLRVWLLQSTHVVDQRPLVPSLQFSNQFDLFPLHGHICILNTFSFTFIHKKIRITTSEILNILGISGFRVLEDDDVTIYRCIYRQLQSVRPVHRASTSRPVVGGPCTSFNGVRGGLITASFLWTSKRCARAYHSSKSSWL